MQIKAFFLGLLGISSEPKPIDFSVPSLAALSAILRDPQRPEWPEGFEWNYRYSASCALGLASKVWPAAFPQGDWFTDHNLKKVFGIPVKDARVIFEQQARHIDGDVQPSHVADAIDRYLGVPVST